MVMGPSGVGKTTLALELGAWLDLPVTHLDRLFWMPGWQERPIESFLPIVEEAAAGDRWVIEGNYRPTIEPRLARADVLIYLDLTRRVYFPRMLWRTLRHFGRERDDLGPGKKDRIELTYFKWLWNHDREHRPRKTREITGYASRVPVVWLTSTVDVRRFKAMARAAAARSADG